jgi:hypothetical protein
MKKIGILEKLADEGKWGELEDAIYTPKTASAKMNKYQKGLLEAQANLLAMKMDAVMEPVAPKKGWSKLSGKLGTEQGGKYKGPDGEDYYVKTPTNPARTHNEVLALKLYNAFGAGVVDGDLVDIDGQKGVATKWIDSKKVDWNDPVVKKEAAKDFAVHALLANWDAVGAGSENPMDNIRMDADGKLRLVDAGGSLEFKGMGGSGKKPFGKEANEWDSLRDPSVNPTMAKAFGGMTPDQLVDSANRLKSIKDENIQEIVDKFHGGTPSEKAAMAETLIARRNSILAKAQALEAKLSGPTAKAEAPAPSPTAPGPDANDPKSAQPTMADAIAATAPPMGMPPKPIITSKSNQGYQKTIDAIHDAMLTGDIAAVEAIATNETSKQTYAKKTHKYKQAVLMAMGSGATGAAAAPAAAASTIPDPPTFSSPGAQSLADTIAANAKNGHIDLVVGAGTPAPGLAPYKAEVLSAMLPPKPKHPDADVQNEIDHVHYLATSTKDPKLNLDSVSLGLRQTPTSSRF